MPDILSIADHADMIVNGYAFSKSNDSVRVLNLNNPASACVLSADGKILETTMDDIELDMFRTITAETGNIWRNRNAKIL